jgi:arylamine N-acetyltransferase
MADMTLDLAGYFERIGYRGAADPTLHSSYRIVSERDASYDPPRF